MSKKGNRTAAKRVYETLRFKLVIVISALVLVSVVSLTIMFIQRQTAQIKAQLLNRGETVAGLIAYNARYGVQIGDKPILDKIIGGVQGDPDVVYCIISDKQHQIITSYNQERADIERVKPAFAAMEPGMTEYRTGKGEEIINIAVPVVLAEAAPEEKEEESSALEDAFFDGAESGAKEETTAAVPGPAAEGSASKRVIGVVQLGITLDNMNKNIAVAIRRTVLFSAGVFLFGLILAFWFGSVISTPIRKVVTVLNDISEGEGDLSQRIHLKARDETGDLAVGFNAFMDKFQEIKKISVFLNELADGGGDLTKRLNIDSGDEVGMLAKGFDRFTDKLHEIIRKVAENTGSIARASQAVSDTTVSLARELDEVAQKSTEVAQSSTHISNGIEKTSGNVTNVNGLMNETEQVCESGVQVVHETRNGMIQIAEAVRASSEIVAKLNESSQKIGDTITTITEIADQTKLIAINAAIEASRVGAQGKGFGVVAEEIRRLASRVTKATEDISQRIRTIQRESFEVVEAMRKSTQNAQSGLELSNRSEDALKNISKGVRDTKHKMGQIAVASNEQASSIGVISKNITSISGSSRQSSEGISATAASMQELNKQVQELRQLVGLFVLDR